MVPGKAWQQNEAALTANRDIAATRHPVNTHRMGLLNPVGSSRGGVSPIAVPFSNEVRNSRIRSCQRLLIRQEHDAEVLRAGLLPEARAVDDHHVLLTNEFLYESLIALRNVDAWECIERTSWRYTTHARRLLAPLLREIAAGTQLALYFYEMILWSFQRWFDRILLRMIG